MISSIDDPKRAVATIFNSAIAAPAIGAAWELGLLDELRDQKKVNVHEFAIQHNLNSGSMQGLATALAVGDVVKHDRDTITAGRLLEEAYQTKSLFHWLTLGSGGLFSCMQYVLRNENRTEIETSYHRDPAAIAYACRDINRQYFDPIFWTAMDRLGFTFHSVIDLGSGSGERLMQILDRYPEVTGMGIDLAVPAIEYATVEALKRGFKNRLSFIHGDVREMSYRDEFACVDLLTCFMMGHDFWPRNNCIATLQRLKKAFPKARRFFLGDTTRILMDCPRSKYAVAEDDVPIFTLGFELGHVMMGVHIPTIEEWEGVFIEGGWRCVRRHLIETQSLSVIFELEHVGLQEGVSML